MLLAGLKEMPMQLIVAALLGIAGAVCILLSTLFGVSPVSDWLLLATVVFFGLGVAVFTQYIVVGIFRDASAM
jgi:hypothetical protein